MLHRISVNQNKHKSYLTECSLSIFLKHCRTDGGKDIKYKAIDEGKHFQATYVLLCTLNQKKQDKTKPKKVNNEIKASFRCYKWLIQD